MISSSFLFVFALSFVFSLIGILLHYEALRGISFVLPLVALQPRRKMVLVVTSILLTHIAEIILYAIAFWLFWELDAPPRLGGMSPAEAFYLSIESFTSLGTSAGFPIGQLRILAGMEALLGLLLIAWSASYTYLAMCVLWSEH